MGNTDDDAAAEQDAAAQGDAQRFTELKALRSSTKGNMTRVKTFIFKKGTNSSVEELECRLGILEAYFKQFLSVQSNIDRLCSEVDAAANLAFVGEVEELYVLTKSKIMALISNRRTSVVDVSMLNATAPATVPSRLRREIKLPRFEGLYADYPKFISIFNKMVHQDETLENCERFLILKESLGAKPLAVIADFDITEANYPKALERLKESYDKKTLMFEEHVAALFDLPKAIKGSSAHLRSIVNTVNARLSAMLSLGEYKDVANALIVFIVMQKLDLESQVKWEEAIDYTNLCSWKQCAAVLSRRCQNLEAREAKTVRTESKPLFMKDAQRDNRTNNSFAKKYSPTSLAIGKTSCDVCKKDGHDIPNCAEFAKMTVQERYKLARGSKVCFICLKKGHSCRGCTASKCAVCNYPHHKLLHRFSSNTSVSPTGEISGSKLLSTVPSTTLHTAVSAPEVFLETAIVFVEDVYGHNHRVRVILDSASQISILSEKMASRLKLKTSSCCLGASGVGEICTQIRKKSQVIVKSRFNNYKTTLEVFIMPKITGPKPDEIVDVSHWNLPKNIEWADPLFNIPAPIDMLLGAEIFLDLMSIGRIKLDENLPKLQKTLLGWVVSGASRQSHSDCNKVKSLLVDCSSTEVVQLDRLVERFWQLEQITLSTSFLTEEEKECERLFEQNVNRDSTGRFVVKIPFKCNVKELGESYHIAERRFLSLERRLDKDPAIKEAYINFIHEYLHLGHMSIVDDKDKSKLKYFSPHQHVLRPDSSSTKLRVVFDCSCKTSTGISLNDVMMKGPVVQDDLLSIVLRFRCFKYAITADVTKMYRQAWVTEEDSFYQAIIWRDSPKDELNAYRLRTITYGTTAAPYLATKCLQMLGQENSAEYPLGSSKILKDFYMDDLISGADSEEDLFKIYDQVSKILSTAGFPLHKWHSNNKQFLHEVPEGDREKPLRMNDAEIIKTLGIIWDPKSDVFRYVRPNINPRKTITKRIVLAELSSLFDPLGLINPVIVKAKVFMQDLWILKINWDESLPMGLHCYWDEFRNKLSTVEDVRVPRYVLSAEECVRVEMHGFADASMRAYGCCIYIRCIGRHGEVNVQLWSAKSRVAPVVTKSLPRLELLAAELLSKLLAKTQNNFTVPVDAVYLWTDSEIVLDWLSVHPSAWSTFVANRVASIQESTKAAIWRHVPSKMNPADIVSRGAYADELKGCDWFSGPKFLKVPCEEWPPNKVRITGAAVNKERRKGATILQVECEKNRLVEWIENQSQFVKLQRRVAVILQVCRKVKGLASTTVQLLDEALIRIVYCLQQHYFRVEYQALKSGGEVPATSKLRSLNIFIESCHGVDILRVGGRLLNAEIPYDAKHQILLPGDSSFVKCYVKFIHEKHYHVGTQALMAIMRQRFWIINARKLIRAVTGKCLLCFRSRPKLQQQLMGDLPEARVNVAEPFAKAGVDFCGPVMTTYRLQRVRLTKSYIAVFICFVTKAVHLEVVSDLTSKAFIAALKRFVARRGFCAHIYCDNGTNFVGARRELKEFKERFLDQQTQKAVSEFCEANSIEFHHIPPRSPHFGGLWEAAVKSAKYHLTRILGDTHLTFEELGTVVTEIEAILNSRPLTSMSNDPNDESVLTPAHLAIGRPLVGISEPTIQSSNISNLNRWARISAIQQHFWRRSSTEYLHELQQRVKWTRKQQNLEEGDLVLVAEENLPPKQWLLGRVTNVVKSAGGCVRVADVKTKKGEIRRAVHKLAQVPRED